MSDVSVLSMIEDILTYRSYKFQNNDLFSDLLYHHEALLVEIERKRQEG